MHRRPPLIMIYLIPIIRYMIPVPATRQTTTARCSPCMARERACQMMLRDLCYATNASCRHHKSQTPFVNPCGCLCADNGQTRTAGLAQLAHCIATLIGTAKIHAHMPHCIRRAKMCRVQITLSICIGPLQVMNAHSAPRMLRLSHMGDCVAPSSSLSDSKTWASTTASRSNDSASTYLKKAGDLQSPASRTSVTRPPFAITSWT